MVATNIELNELAKCLSIANFHCICKDEIKILLKNSPTNIIVNPYDFDKNVNGY